jgi:hypothetical protein
MLVKLSSAEQLICNQQVAGSTPVASPKRTTVPSGAADFVPRYQCAITHWYHYGGVKGNGIPLGLKIPSLQVRVLPPLPIQPCRSTVGQRIVNP